MFQGREKVWWMIEASGHRCSRVERRFGREKVWWMVEVSGRRCSRVERRSGG